MSNSSVSYTATDIWWSLAKLFFTVILVLFISNFIALGLALPLVNFDLTVLEPILENPLAYPQYRMVLMQMQGVISVLTFAVAPLLYVKYFDEANVSVNLNPQPNFHLPWAMLTPLLVVTSMPFMSWLLEINQNIALPDAWRAIQEWAKEMEDQRRELTTFLTTFDNFIDFLVALLVLAVVPAVGEEILFRGILQNKINLFVKNIHWAILVASIVFSAVHFQFYGFVPRLLLGVLFGYLYVWSGNLYVPILAHFINNGVTLLLIYLYQQKLIAIDVMSNETTSLEVVFPTFLLFVGFLYLFKKITDYQ